ASLASGWAGVRPTRTIRRAPSRSRLLRAETFRPRSHRGLPARSWRRTFGIAAADGLEDGLSRPVSSCLAVLPRFSGPGLIEDLARETKRLRHFIGEVLAQH